MGKWSQAQRRYSASSKGRESRRRYQTSIKGIETRKRYQLKRKARLAEAKQTGEIKPVENKVEVAKIKESPKSKKV